MKSYKYIIAALFLVAISTAIFIGCEKENKNLDFTKNSIKNHKSIEETNSFELYTPSNDSIVYLLTSMTNYMNNADENPMPNMELSKAIWIMESFFNIGICDKQNLFCDEATNSEIYTLELDFICDENSNIMIIGNDLQTQFHTLLNTIINDICPEYAMEFGDVYVNSINLNENTVLIEINVNYGIKADSETSTFPRLCFASETQYLFATFSNNVSYLANEYNYEHNYIFNYPSVRDTKMERVLNCRYLEYLFNIIKFEKYYLYTYDYFFKENHCSEFPCLGEFVAHKHATYSTRIGSEFLTPANYAYYGDVYRDSIYENIVPFIPSGYIPFKAACFYFFIGAVSEMDWATLDFHEFGIEYICKYISITEIPQCDDLIEVEFNSDNSQCLCD